MSELWDRAKSSGKRGVEDFKNLAKELDKNNNLTDNITKEFFNDIEKELRIEKIQETIEDYTEKGLKDKTDPIKPTKTESSKVGDFVGNILKTKLPNDAGEAKAVQVIIENLFTGKEFEKLKGKGLKGDKAKSDKKGGGSESQKQDWQFHELRPSDFQGKPNG